MTIKVWSEFYDYTRTQLNGVASNLVDNALMHSARDFCIETNLDAIDFVTQNVSAGTASYTITCSDSQKEPCSVSKVWVDGSPLFYITLAALESKSALWTADTSTLPTDFTQYADDNVFLYPNPTLSYTSGLVCSGSARPTLTATGIEKWIGDKYVETIAAGAKARLMMQPGRPWTDVAQAQVQGAMFMGGISSAKIQAYKTNTRGSLTARMRPFA